MNEEATKEELIEAIQKAPVSELMIEINDRYFEAFRITKELNGRFSWILKRRFSPRYEFPMRSIRMTKDYKTEAGARRSLINRLTKRFL